MFSFTRKHLCFFVILALFVCLIPGSAIAKAKYNWSFAQPWTRPLSNEGYKLFCEKVEEYSNGQIKIKFFGDGLLGTHDESFHGMQDGSIEVGAFSPYVSIVPGGMMNWMPWTIESWDEAKIAYANPSGILYRVMETAWNEVGGHLLFNVSQGSYGLGNTVRALRTPSDLKDLKMRVSASLAAVKMLENMGKGTGMTLQTLPWAELYNALSRGVVDGCWDMWPSLIQERHYEVLKFYSDVNFLWDNNNIVINKKLWDSLSPELQEAVNRAASEAEAFLYERGEAAEADFVKELEGKEGFTIVRLTAEEREEWRSKSSMTGIWEELCKPWLEKHYPGQNMTQKVQDELKRIHEEVLAKK